MADKPLEAPAKDRRTVDREAELARQDAVRKAVAKALKT